VNRPFEPAVFLKDHPGSHVVALAAAALAGSYFGWKAAHSEGLRRVLWSVLLVSQMIQVAGIAWLGRRPAKPRRNDRSQRAFVALTGGSPP
jgi:hypothetical protein